MLSGVGYTTVPRLSYEIRTEMKHEHGTWTWIAHQITYIADKLYLNKPPPPNMALKKSFTNILAGIGIQQADN